MPNYLPKGVVSVKIDTHRLVSMTEANQNFSRVARLVNESGSAVILKNNHPRYLVLDVQQLGDALQFAAALSVEVTAEEESAHGA